MKTTTISRHAHAIMDAKEMLEAPDEPLAGTDTTHQLTLRMLEYTAAMLRNLVGQMQHSG
jgi:hypothetical protein